MMKSLVASLLLITQAVQGQRFLRDGFTSTMSEEFKYETGMDSVPTGVGGMPREMFVLQNLDLELVPHTSKSDYLKVPDNPELTKHLRKYLQQPIRLQLDARKGGAGYRAFGITPDGKRLRGSWRRRSELAPSQLLMGSDFLKVSYDDALRSRAMVVELELVLPKIPGKKQNPVVTYQMALEGGVMNPKAVLPRGDVLVQAHPDVRQRHREESSSWNVGAARLGTRLKAGIVDPNWARGRTIVRPGRSTGLI